MDKTTLEDRQTGLKYGRGYVYSIQYHIVWCTKYRRPVLAGSVRTSLLEMLYQTAGRYRFHILETEVMPDHVHILVDCSPQFYIPDMVKVLKGYSARYLFSRHPELLKQLWGGHLWNPSYCVVTVSDRSIDIVKRYIASQKER